MRRSFVGWENKFILTRFDIQLFLTRALISSRLESWQLFMVDVFGEIGGGSFVISSWMFMRVRIFTSTSREMELTDVIESIDAYSRFPMKSFFLPERVANFYSYTKVLPNEMKFNIL